jgi:hypothetical protein
VHKALSALVCNRAPFHQLFVELENARACLRGIRKCFYKIQSALQAQMPHQYSMKWQSVISLNPEAVGLPTDEGPAQAWVQALENLLVDPDADLPTEI